MLREILTLVVPLALPTAVYLAWLHLSRLTQASGGPVAWRGLPWLWLAVSGVALAAIVLFVVTVHFGTTISGTYVPPRLQDGQIVPGHIEPKK